MNILIAADAFKPVKEKNTETTNSSNLSSVMSRSGKPLSDNTATLQSANSLPIFNR